MKNVSDTNAYLRVWMSPPPPLISRGLDPGTAMNIHSFVAAIHARIISRSLEIQISGK